MKSFIKRWIKTVLGAIFLIGVFTLQRYLYKTDVENDKKVFERGARTVGIYTGLTGKFNHREYEYYLNGERYRDETGDSRLPKGIDTLAFFDEMYEIRYLPSDPTISQINFLKRFDELTLYGVDTIGLIDAIHWIPSEKRWVVRYIYDEGWKMGRGKRYFKNLDTTRFKEGSPVKVRYSTYRKGKKELPRKNYMILE